MDPNELLGGLGNGSSEDRTVHLREGPYGPRVEFVIIERTSFDKAYPETTKELRTGPSLPCGHHVTKDNPFGGYCVLCTQEYCSRCSRSCPTCGRSISINCCAREYAGSFVCLHCRRTLRRREAARAVFSFLMRPFLDHV